MNRLRPEVPWSALLAGRVAGAGLLAATAGIHLHLWDAGYRLVPWIGPLFLLQAVAGFLLGAGVLLAPRRWLPLVAVLGALLQAGTLGGLVLSVTVGLLGFGETTAAPFFWTSVWVEAAGAAVLVAVAAVRARPRGARRERERSAARPVGTG